MVRMEFIASIDRLHEILDWIRKELEPMQFESSTLHRVTLASEEALVNIIHHAYQGRPEKVEIEVRCLKTHAEITFEDGGPPFNPLKAKAVDSTLPIEEREAGGLGIHFIRQCIDEVRYMRQKEKNILIFVIPSIKNNLDWEQPS